MLKILIKIRKVMVISLTAVSISFFAQSPTFAATGTYTSAAIGADDAVGFINFKVMEQSTGGGITYNFACSKDNYASWSANQTIATTDGSLDLSSISQLQDSKYLKVKITMNDAGNLNPSLKGFKITYEKPGGNVTTTTTDTSGGAISGKGGVSKLVSTGGNLGINILIALVATGVIAYFLLRPRTEK